MIRPVATAAPALQRVERLNVDPEDDAVVLDDPTDDPELINAPSGNTPAVEAPADEDEEVIVSIGDEPAPAADDPAKAPEWLRDLRKSNREKDRRIRELEQRIAAPAAAPQDLTLGPKPTLEGSEFDAERFERDLEAWHDRKREVDEQQRKRADAAKAQNDAWQARLNDYGKAKTELKVADFEDAEATARDTFSVVQQGVIVNGADNAAVLIYALGKNPKKAKELAAISDPVKFAFAVAKLETQLKVTPRKTAPVPERQIRGSAQLSGAVDSTLERLRAEADKTGDRTKVAAYLNAQRAKKAA